MNKFLLFYILLFSFLIEIKSSQEKENPFFVWDENRFIGNFKKIKRGFSFAQISNHWKVFFGALTLIGIGYGGKKCADAIQNGIKLSGRNAFFNFLDLHRDITYKTSKYGSNLSYSLAFVISSITILKNRNNFVAEAQLIRNLNDRGILPKITEDMEENGKINKYDLKEYTIKIIPDALYELITHNFYCLIDLLNNVNDFFQIYYIPKAEYHAFMKYKDELLKKVIFNDEKLKMNIEENKKDINDELLKKVIFNDEELKMNIEKNIEENKKDINTEVPKIQTKFFEKYKKIMEVHKKNVYTNFFWNKEIKIFNLFTYSFGIAAIIYSIYYIEQYGLEKAQWIRHLFFLLNHIPYLNDICLFMYIKIIINVDWIYFGLKIFRFAFIFIYPLIIYNKINKIKSTLESDANIIKKGIDSIYYKIININDYTSKENTIKSLNVDLGVDKEKLDVNLDVDKEKIKNFDKLFQLYAPLFNVNEIAAQKIVTY